MTSGFQLWKFCKTTDYFLRDKRGTSAAAPSIFLDPTMDPTMEGSARQWPDQYVMYTKEQFAVRHIVQVDM